MTAILSYFNLINHFEPPSSFLNIAFYYNDNHYNQNMMLLLIFRLDTHNFGEWAAGENIDMSHSSACSQ